MAIQVFAPAKVNLHLAVGESRGDGYHDVVTVLHALSFGDTVTIVPDTAFGFACTPDLGLKAEDNLACRAATVMAERFGKPLNVTVSVEKRIPSGAGLGGASADAAGVIVGLARLWGIDAREGSLVEVARGLGADVPFFLLGGAALYTGRGDLFERSLPALDASVVLVKPAEPVLTAEAYATFDRQGHPPSPSTDELVAALESGDAVRVAGQLHNNMAEAAHHLAPGIGAALRLLNESPGVIGSVVAGSGSASFGICEDDATALSAAESAHRAGLWASATRFNKGGCEVHRTT